MRQTLKAVLLGTGDQTLLGDALQGGITARAANRMQGKEQRAGLRLAPEPINELAARGRATGTHAGGFKIEIAQILTGEADGRVIGLRCDSAGPLAGQDIAKEANGMPERKGADTDGGPAVGLAKLGLPGRELFDFAEHVLHTILLLRHGRFAQRHGADQPFHVFRIALIRCVLVEIVEDDRAIGALKQSEDGSQDVHLKGGIIRRAERTAKIERHPKGARWAKKGGVLTDEAEPGGRDAGMFKVVGDRANGARAIWSDRHQQGGVDLVFLEQACEFVARRFDLVWFPSGTHERVVIVRN